MTINLPYKVRAALYVLTALGAPVVVYLKSKGIIGDLELTLWSGLVTVVTAVAALNTSPNNKETK